MVRRCVSLAYAAPPVLCRAVPPAMPRTPAAAQHRCLYNKKKKCRSSQNRVAQGGGANAQGCHDWYKYPCQIRPTCRVLAIVSWGLLAPIAVCRTVGQSLGLSEESGSQRTAA